MTQTTSDTAKIQPSDILMALLVTFLAPIFRTVCGGDVALARLAAADAINAYRARNPTELLTVAQIVSFSLASLASLSLSLAEDVPVPLMLRLRGNATACNRTAENNRRALDRANDRYSPEAPPANVDPEPGIMEFLSKAARADVE